MASTILVIGVDPSELRWVRMLVNLLRHADPQVPELTRQALQYLTDTAGKRDIEESDAPFPAGVLSPSIEPECPSLDHAG